MSSLVPQPWDRVYVFEAYTSPDYLTGTLGLRWTQGGESAAVFDDRYQLILFVAGNRVVAWADVDKFVGRFDLGASYVARRDAVLDVRKTKSGVRVVRKGAAPSADGWGGFGRGQAQAADAGRRP